LKRAQKLRVRGWGEGWLWIKYKRDYKSEMMDTVDLVAVGAFHGREKSWSFGA
jgi:DNA ligase-1